MSEREWKPGDVALVSVPGVPEQRATWATTCPKSGHPVGHHWHIAQRNTYLPANASGLVVRPLVVIDPEDREQVERLIGLYADQRSTLNANDRTGDMQAALREYADPKPPKPYTSHDGLIAPWPVVNECQSSHIAGHECPQCAWTHGHEWVEWSHSTGPGKPVRCTKCGGRKCDFEDCSLQRHHKGDHA